MVNNDKQCLVNFLRAETIQKYPNSKQIEERLGHRTQDTQYNLSV